MSRFPVGLQRVAAQANLANGYIHKPIPETVFCRVCNAEQSTEVRSGEQVSDYYRHSVLNRHDNPQQKEKENN